MQRNGIVVLFVLLLLTCSTLAYGAGAAISVTPELLDLGNVSQGGPAEGEFTVTNSGDADLVIGTVRTSCSCTATTPDRKTVPPGESTKVRVKLTTANRVGKQTHTVYIESNAANNSPFRVHVTAFVQSSTSSQVETEEATAASLSSTNPVLPAVNDLPTDKVQIQQSRKTGAVIVVTPESLDLGNVSQTGPAEGEFTVTNEGDADLVIGRVRASCSCTAIAPDRSTLPPGESTKIKTRLSTANRIGKQTHSVYIESNAVNDNVVRAQISAFIQSSSSTQSEVVEASASSGPSTNIDKLAFDNIQADEVLTKQIDITATEPGGIKLLSIVSQPDWLRVTSRSAGVGVQRHITLNVTPITSKIKENLSDVITIRTNHPRRPNVDIHVSASLGKSVLVAPNVLTSSTDTASDVNFGTIDKGSKAERTVILKSFNNKAFSVERVDNPLPYLKVSTSTKSKGLENHVKVSVLKTAPIGDIKGNITIHTTDQKQKKIVLPVLGTVKESGK